MVNHEQLKLKKNLKFSFLLRSEFRDLFELYKL